MDYDYKWLGPGHLMHLPAADCTAADVEAAGFTPDAMQSTPAFRPWTLADQVALGQARVAAAQEADDADAVKAAETTLAPWLALVQQEARTAEIAQKKEEQEAEATRKREKAEADAARKVADPAPTTPPQEAK